MVFIRPKILRDGLAAAIATDAKYNYIRDEQLKARRPEDRGPAAASLHAGTASAAAFPRRWPPGETAPRHRSGPTARRRHAPPPSDRPPSTPCQRRRRTATNAMNDAVVTEAPAPRRVGFAFAKRHGVLVRRVHEGIAECVYRPGAAPLAVAEVRRYLGVPLAARESRGSSLRLAAAAGLRGRQRRHGSRRRRRGIHRPGAPRAGPARAGRPARERRRRTHHSTDQRRAHAGGEGKRFGHSRRAVRKPAGGALPRRRRAAGSPAEQTRSRAAGGLAHQGHVQARHRREAPAAGRAHQPQDRRPFGRRARLDDSIGTRRTRGAAYPRQAGRPPAPVGARHGSEDRAAHRRSVPQAARHHPGDGTHRLGQDHHACMPASST